MSNIIAIAPEQRALDHYVSGKLAKLSRDIDKSIDTNVANMLLAIGLDRASRVIDEDTADKLEARVIKLGADRKLANGKAVEIGQREFAAISVAALPGPRKATDLPTYKMRRLEQAADRLLAARA